MINDVLNKVVILTILIKTCLVFDMEEYKAGHIFEGDIVGLSKHEIKELRGNISSKWKAFRNAVVKDRSWPNGTIPYKIVKSEKEFQLEQLAILQEAFNVIHNKTCVR